MAEGKVFFRGQIEEQRQACAAFYGVGAVTFKTEQEVREAWLLVRRGGCLLTSGAYVDVRLAEEVEVADGVVDGVEGTFVTT